MSLVLIVLVQANPAAAQKPVRPPDVVRQMAAQLEPTQKLVYKKVGDRELLLHVFQPQDWQPGDTRTCFVTFHGGGWTGGEPRRMYPYAAHFAKQGMVGISVEYRLISSQRIPADQRDVTVFDSVKDGRSALRYIRGHAKELGIDPEKIVVSGASAGGHVAAGTGLFDGINESGDDLKVSPIPNALVLLYPVIDTSADGYGNQKIGARWKEISPAHQVNGREPPTIVFHGTGDTVTPFAGAQAFQSAMQKAGNRCELDVNEGGVHGYLIYDLDLYNDTLDKAEKFLTSLRLMP